MFYVLLSNGDSAEAETPEEAVYAARWLHSEASAHGAASSLLTASFYNPDGDLVRGSVRRAEMGSV